MNRALGDKHIWARLRLPSASTPLFSCIPHTRVSIRPHSPSSIKCCPAPHSVALGPVRVQVSYWKVPVMIEALNFEHNFVFYNKTIFYKNVNALSGANSFGFIFMYYISDILCICRLLDTREHLTFEVSACNNAVWNRVDSWLLSLGV